jgi:hypothetical protein
MVSRKVAVAIPALNEAGRIVACLTALVRQQGVAERVEIVVLCNNCQDQTADIVRTRFGGGVHVREVSLLRPHNHAGWARRLSIEAAVEFLGEPADVLMCTDADTVASGDWIKKNLAYLSGGFDAVAGFAAPSMAEWRQLQQAHRARFSRLRKYHALLAYLRRDRHLADPWPRHEYEGGASIAMTFGLYRRLGELPAPPVGEDKAIFTAIRGAGGRIRHPMDARVFTSCRYVGRASGGMADTIAAWGCQGEDAPIEGTWPLNVELGYAPQAKSRPLTFGQLDQEVQKAQLLVRSARLRSLCLSA